MKTKVVAFMQDGTYRVGYAGNRDQVCAVLDLLTGIDMSFGLETIDVDEPFVLFNVFSNGKVAPLGTFDPVEAINFYRKVSDIVGGDCNETP